MVPRIAHTYAQKNMLKMKAYMYCSYQFVLFLSIPMFFGIHSIAGTLVLCFLGSGYEPVIKLLSILSVLLLATGISNVTGIQYLMATEQQKNFHLLLYAEL